MASSLLYLPLTKVSHLIKKGSLSVTDLCSVCIKRIQDTKCLNAFITVTEELARKQAESALSRISKGQSLSPLDGIPVSFKDNWNTKHIRTTCASKMLSNYYSPYNATVVKRLSDKGAVVVGKNNMDEFAMGSGTVESHFGPTRNPWRSGIQYKLRKRSDHSALEDANVQSDCIEDKDFFVAGGSSGGSAVAVATGACFGAIGSDTGGSTRHPSAFCGVVGLKPTYGLVSRSGLIPLCNSLDVPGIIARTVDDVALLLNSVAGHDEMDSTTLSQANVPFTLPDNPIVSGLHIGIPKEYQCPGMSEEVLDTWNIIADRLEKAGAKVTSVTLPHTKYSIMCYSVLCCCDVASNFARYDGIRYGYRSEAETLEREKYYAATRRDGLGETVRERILAGNYFLLRSNYERYFIQAAKVRRLICDDFSAVFRTGVDLLLTPVTLTEPVSYREWIKRDNWQHNSVDDFCTQPVNMAGLPAVSVPCKLSRQGLPLSLQLIGHSFQEERMLTAAKWIEQQMDFPLLDFS